jgi:hypothetical protein
MNLDAVLLQLGLIDDAGFDQDEIADPERLTFEDMAATIMETFRFYLAYQESGDLDAALAQTKNEKLNQSLKKIAPLIQAVDA